MHKSQDLMPFNYEENKANNLAYFIHLDAYSTRVLQMKWISNAIIEWPLHKLPIFKFFIFVWLHNYDDSSKWIGKIQLLEECRSQ